MKKGVKKKKQNNSRAKNYVIYTLITILLIVLLFFYLNKGQTGVDDNSKEFTRLFNRSSFENTTEENESYQKGDIVIKYPDPFDEFKIKAPKGTSKDDSKEGEVPEEILSEDINDTDVFSLGDGKLDTLNIWKIGTCYDPWNLIGNLYDSCNGEILTEFYLSDEKCTSVEVNCSEVGSYFGETATSSCFNGECILKLNGLDFLTGGFILIGGEDYWDECLSEKILNEYYIDEEGKAKSIQVDCLEEYGGKSYCNEGACKVIEETEKFSCDSFCKKREEYIGGNYPLCSSNQDLIKYNSSIQCCCTIEPVEAFETDYGHNAIIKGECVDSVDFYEDHCIDQKTLKEYYIDSNDKYYCISEDVICNGICSQGKCIAYDEDAAYPTGQYSSPSKCYNPENEIYEDTCYCPILGVCETSQLLLKEWKIENNQCVSELINCTEEFGTGYICGNEGACISRNMR